MYQGEVTPRSVGPRSSGFHHWGYAAAGEPSFDTSLHSAFSPARQYFQPLVIHRLSILPVPYGKSPGMPIIGWWKRLGADRRPLSPAGRIGSSPMPPPGIMAQKPSRARMTGCRRWFARTGSLPAWSATSVFLHAQRSWTAARQSPETAKRGKPSLGVAMVRAWSPPVGFGRAGARHGLPCFINL